MDRNVRPTPNEADRVNGRDTVDLSDHFHSLPVGKREKFLNFMRTTKNEYIPNITSTISQRTFNGLRSSTGTMRDNSHPSEQVRFPQNMEFEWFPAYTTEKYDHFETLFRLKISTPGNMYSRKNRLLISMSKQYLKKGNSFTNDNSVNSGPLASNDLFGGPPALHNSPSSSISSSSAFDTSSSPPPFEHEYMEGIPNGDNEVETMKERMIGFFKKHVEGVPLVIDLQSGKDSTDIKTFHETSDARGNVEVKLKTEFRPATVTVSLDHSMTNFPNHISKTFDCTFVKPGGVGVISDIDDTIKHTGVTGDRRSMFRNVFINPMESWVVDGIPLWYKTLKDTSDVDFFYVSNSPSQLFQTLQSYLSMYLPEGPLFLKQYNGNFLSSLMTSSANRKLGVITRILSDFPEKKFILVGDSGEQDFEAYISTAMNYPDQIIGVYIRCSKNSMSDLGLGETTTMIDLNNLIKREYVEPVNGDMKPIGPPRVPAKRVELTESQAESIRASKIPSRSSHKSPSPSASSNAPSSSSSPTSTIGSFPLSLSPKESFDSLVNQLHQLPTRTKKLTRIPPPPLLPPRRKAASVGNQVPGDEMPGDQLSVNRKAGDQIATDQGARPPPDDGYFMPSSQNDYDTYNGNFDKRADAWSKRVSSGISQLSEIRKYDMSLMFFDDPSLALEDSFKRIQSVTNK
ncbi:phosphatidate phosphatase APP1 KNAG_0M01860 [Huiozyma naganishii CBS 8797]|uniref:Phosphatidate phosphatase APP1 catalytic domain-containing protein n=1 Tax=Huiozyma naganishii (strain ATCC MYA-139 / BCRC 22969 / CBS 8797 / KCTC 17520 / NBRC 10181 / NCYC 3082 / Yp74L-3) TaxID=1071383 RepID=J7SAU0_HUIN7|nr:hypothetical protein KNAG_0M01860 [Kazachstania naganishii CBS 8797]CCK73039.1 hypothetical protein KNAG_0M01860 [Kazachstania naganishii CBS 8797]